MVSTDYKMTVFENSEELEIIKSVKVFQDPMAAFQRVIIAGRLLKKKQSGLFAQHPTHAQIPNPIKKFDEGLEILDCHYNDGIALVLDSKLCLHKIWVDFKQVQTVVQPFIKSYESVDLKKV